MTYVDGFLLPMATDKIDDYRKLAELAAGVWNEHGALDYKECQLDDDGIEGVRSFKPAADTAAGETVIFAFITFKSREHRDEVNARVMADPRMNEMNMDSVPFESRRMAYAGFRTIVEWQD
ncbi:MAG: DUF1428 domain-containing protein [Pseudomonadales bacterium]